MGLRFVKSLGAASAVFTGAAGTLAHGMLWAASAAVFSGMGIC